MNAIQWDKIERQCATLILAGRYGRAIRVWAKATKKGCPRMWAQGDRQKWANDILARRLPKQQ